MTDPTAVIGWAERSEFGHRGWPAAQPHHLRTIRAELRRRLAPLALLGDADNDLMLVVNGRADRSSNGTFLSWLWRAAVPAVHTFHVPPAVGPRS